ncbi:thioesterase family protein [Arthrobacter yangruifuii]|uniref:Thioesterase family protein n=1 Tax=Arthrobacter yangruifuii TaxID=2606616 RepID=A0A5N6MT17_9MICC|nr:thioesterase family protein [Arthrobacter yangruifuii]KAD3720565.1 thioesterase family protein [Arthrobacter yangruifuii]
MAESYYRSLGNGAYEATIHTQGAWNPQEQHMAPISGLLAHCLEEFQPRPELRMARISYDIFGLIPRTAFEVKTSVLRPGRTIELVQAEMVAGGRTAVRATAWRLARGSTAEVSAVEEDPMPGPAEAGTHEGMTAWPGAFIESLEKRALPGLRPGRGRAWLRTPHEMVEGMPTSDLVRLVGMVDTANGISTRVPPGGDSYIFPNVDLQLHLHRDPRGEWLGLDTRVTFGTDGIGLTSAVLHDIHGPFGRSEQILTVRPIGGA